MIKDLKRLIGEMTEEEAKSFLLLTMMQLKTVQESNQSPKQMIEDLHNWQEKIISFAQNKERESDRAYNTVHMVCGPSSAGSLKVGLGDENKVIGFPDYFSFGPIYELHKGVGRERRYEWLRNHLNYGDDYIEEDYERKFSETLKEIDAIPDSIPIVLWTAENADEQTGARYLLYLLKAKKNDVYMINTTLAFQELYNTREYQYFFPRTAWVDPEKLNTIYQKKVSNPLTEEERVQFEQEWLTLLETKEVLRVWENNTIKGKTVDYYDKLILTAARKLHAEQREKDFIKSARLIGQVYGQLDEGIMDTFLEYRVRTLIYNGFFEIKGIPKAMRYYSVKLK
ncbi:DUF1835 domain-containing protein [Oceanobacillus kapialis]|uniref:DUF1835 domain-containing protein n=1 Tax=Oceanobacillus kapialis TaxID=481353 RepID=UPI00384C9478